MRIRRKSKLRLSSACRLASVWVLPGRDEVVSHLFGQIGIFVGNNRQFTSGTWSILRYWWLVSSFHSGQGSRLTGLGPLSSGIEIGNSGEVGSLSRQNNIFWTADTPDDSPMDNKVGPKIAHHSGDLPVHGREVEDAGGEEVDELVPVGHPSRDRRLLVGEEEIPEAWVAIMLKWVVVRVAVAKVVELHELISWGLDEEGSHHLKTNNWLQICGEITGSSYIDQSINHLVPIT